MFVFDRGILFMTAPSGARLRVGALTKTTVKDMIENSPASSQYQFPIKFVGGKQSLIAVAESANLDGRVIGELCFGATSSAGSFKFSDVSATLATGAVTPAPPAGYTWNEDLGVIYCDTGAALAKVVGAPAAGQYAVTAGVYTFNAADAGKAVKMAFLSSGAQGLQYAINNNFQGLLPTFEAVLVGTYGDKQTFLRLYQVVSEQLSLALALEQWAVQEFTFQAQSNSGLQVGLLSVSDL